MPKAKKLTKKQIKEKSEKLKKIRKDFLEKMDKLRKKQDKILADYMKTLEEKQMEEIKKGL